MPKGFIKTKKILQSSRKVVTQENNSIRFEYYVNDAPITVKAFSSILPFTGMFMHAKVSGQEIWIDDIPNFDIIQENVSVFTEIGEVVLVLLKPARTKTANCLGIYYGEGGGFDCCNIFAKVVDEDLIKLKELGEQIWENGKQLLTFQNID